MATYEAEIKIFDHAEYNLPPMETFHEQVDAESDEDAQRAAKQRALQRMDELNAGAYEVTLTRDGETVMHRSPIRRG